jgi:Uma2 family endonuclease
MLRFDTLTAPPPVEYPDDDGLPMADNSKQFWWITTIAGNLAALYRDRPDVLVGGNMLWYAREGDPDERYAPDVFVVFGRPKGDRGSYKQWEENHVPMTVVFEIISPSNTWRMIPDKVLFYDDYGAEEFYAYDPDTNDLDIYLRGKSILRKIRPSEEFVSPKLGIRFDISGEELVLRHADGRPFLPFEELEAERENAIHQATLAKQQATLAIEQTKEANQRFHRLAELVLKQASHQATPDELAELQRLLESSPGDR